MNILEIAKSHGFMPTDRMGYYYAGIGDIEAFATAIAKQAVADYVAGLVPVAWMTVDEMINFRADEYFTIPLYALPLGETK